MGSHLDSQAVIARTRFWLETAVIGLEFCPFAAPVHAKGLIRFVVSEAESEWELEADLGRELQFLTAQPSSRVETTLLIHPWVLNDFPEYNQFLDVADRLLATLDLGGIIQIASFHPDYQFAGTDADDITHFTNRSPFPLLHLLREESVSRAVDSMADPASIPTKNQAVLRRLGRTRWDQMMKPADDCREG